MGLEIIFEADELDTPPGEQPYWPISRTAPMLDGIRIFDFTEPEGIGFRVRSPEQESKPVLTLVVKQPDEGKVYPPAKVALDIYIGDIFEGKEIWSTAHIEVEVLPDTWTHHTATLDLSLDPDIMYQFEVARNPRRLSDNLRDNLWLLEARIAFSEAPDDCGCDPRDLFWHGCRCGFFAREKKRV